MKKIIQINTVCHGSSVGTIIERIQKGAIEAGIVTVTFFGRRKSYKDLPCKRYGNLFSFWFHVGITTLFDLHGLGSYYYTKKMVKQLEKEQPDIIHLHNIHGYYINIKVLFRYLAHQYKGKILWTFHDCWPFTGHCAYFTMANCDKWMTQCRSCPNKRKYPISLGLDRSKKNYQEKKVLFTKLDNLMIVVPSHWMEQLVKQSFFKGNDIVVINNGIDLSIFDIKQDICIRNKYKIQKDKIILLGVSNVWEERKGLGDFLSLSEYLPDNFVIVLVGLDFKQRKQCPSNIIGIKRTENQEELAKLYSEADIFINPSREESFSLVTIEAMACGTPVIALNTSAVQELICKNNGVVIDDVSAFDYLSAINILLNICLTREEVRQTVLKYSINNQIKKIIELYLQ